MGDYDVIERINMIRDAISEAKRVIDRVGEPGREVAIAFTHLDEARLWAIESVSSQAVTIAKH